MGISRKKRVKPTGLSSGMSDFDLLLRGFVRDICRDTVVCTFVKCNCLSCKLSARLVTMDDTSFGVLYCQDLRKVVGSGFICRNWSSRLVGY